jgi:hypothetical protein
MFLEHMPKLKSMASQYVGGWVSVSPVEWMGVTPGVHSWEYLLMLLELAPVILFELNSSFVIDFL